MNFIRKAWSAAPIATTIFALALLASVFFGARSVIFWYHRPPISEREQPIAAWMTPRYVIHSWDVPREVVFDTIAVPRPLPDGPLSLEQIADLRGIPVDRIINDLEAAIAAFLDDRGTPPTDPNTGSGQ